MITESTDINVKQSLANRPHTQHHTATTETGKDNDDNQSRNQKFIAGRTTFVATKPQPQTHFCGI